MKRLGDIGGIPLYGHWALLPGVALWLLLGEPLELLGTGTALLLHELAHGLTARGLGLSVEAMELYPFGACLRMPGGGRQRERLLVALAGPLCGAGAAGLALLLWRFLPGGGFLLAPFCRGNLVLSLINLLPGYPLDGGRVLCLLLEGHMPESRARRAAAWTGIALGLGLLALGVLGAMQGRGNGTAFLFSLFLCLAAGQELLALPESRILSQLDKERILRSGGPVDVKDIAVGDSMELGTAMRLLRRGQYTRLLVISRENRLLGIVEESSIAGAAARMGLKTPIGRLVTASGGNFAEETDFL